MWNLNWRRGFVRIWVLVSVVWVIGVSYLAYFDESKGIQYIVQNEELIAKEKRRWEVSGESGITEKGETNDESAVNREKLKQMLRERKLKLKLKLKQESLEDNLSVIEARRKAAISKIPIWIALALIPPTGVIIFGLLFGWVLTGFKPKLEDQ